MGARVEWAVVKALGVAVGGRSEAGAGWRVVGGEGVPVHRAVAATMRESPQGDCQNQSGKQVNVWKGTWIDTGIGV